MLLFLSDEDFNRRIVRDLRRRLPHLDVVRVQDVGINHPTGHGSFGMGGKRKSRRLNARRNDDEQTRL